MILPLPLMISWLPWLGEGRQKFGEKERRRGRFGRRKKEEANEKNEKK